MGLWASLVGKFSATAPAIKIRGGDYKWIDTGDGYKTVLDVPLLAECAKGTKGAPYDVTKDVLEEFATTALRRYQDGHFCATAFVGHNPDVPITHPSFAGYVLPKRVAKCRMESGEKWTLYGDVKLSNEKFEEARAGKLPYVSPEVPWTKRRVSGLAFLDTEPPFNEFALFTLGEEVIDPTAKFDAKEEPTMTFDEALKALAEANAKIAKFEADAKVKPAPKDSEVDDADDFAKKYPKVSGKLSAIDRTLSAMAEKMGLKLDDADRKPNALPVEPEDSKNKPEAKMMDPEVAAKFSALTNQTAELAAKITAQENEKRAVALVAKADSVFAKKIVPPLLKEQIATFAADWAPLKDGEARFDKYLEALKPSLRDKPTLATDFTSVDATDPIVAKFAKEGPGVMEEAAKFAAQWKEIKRRYPAFEVPEEKFVENEMSVAVASRNGEIEERR